jgi:hypothetical protein
MRHLKVRMGRSITKRQSNLGQQSRDSRSYVFTKTDLDQILHEQKLNTVR